MFSPALAARTTFGERTVPLDQPGPARARRTMDDVLSDPASARTFKSINAMIALAIFVVAPVDFLVFDTAAHPDEVVAELHALHIVADAGAVKARGAAHVARAAAASTSAGFVTVTRALKTLPASEKLSQDGLACAARGLDDGGCSR